VTLARVCQSAVRACGPHSMGESTESPWLVAICSVLFDLDVGQRIDSIVPEGALTDEEANDVAFHSFPVRRLNDRWVLSRVPDRLLQLRLCIRFDTSRVLAIQCCECGA
jgi:hypothetical protein